MKFRLLLAAGLMCMTVLSSFKPVQKSTPGKSTWGAWIISDSHSGGELTSCDYIFTAVGLYDDDTVTWLVNNVIVAYGREVMIENLYPGDEIKIRMNVEDSDYIYDYWDTIIPCP